MSGEETPKPLLEAVQEELNQGRLKRREHLKSIRAAAYESETVVEDWPTLRKNLTGHVFPKMHAWVKEIRAVVKPGQIRQLHKQRRALERLSGITWWHPRGAWLRARVLFYGLGLLGIGLFYLAVVLGGLTLIAMMVYRLISWWQDFF
ncbi:hypothetical protein [Acanthopleuribacter pedis]|uniref:Uncharacterized protein n=1 Tax=Acanthopleuribacter pedis TaxID=442870 RepID=A0A8J7Q3K7_9BACT|nr:hypothetical protein [Acanthopleuribacter pedis]MBO1319927.1 hypothetical protein [Acanthopleuribacter pedis]